MTDPEAPPPTVRTRLESFLTGLPIGAERPPPPPLTELHASPLRARHGPLALMIATPILGIAFWMACAHHDGAITAMLAAGPLDWLRHAPTPSWVAVEIVVAWVAVQAVLLQVLPGETMKGPVTPSGAQPEYKLNGVLAWVVTHVGLFGVMWPLGLVDPGALYDRYGELLALLTPAAFAWCLFLYWKGRHHPTSTDAVWTGNPVFDFFQGIELHPRLGRLNLKQLINCRVSMMGWSVAFGCFAVAQWERTGALSTSMWASTFVLVAYLFKFFWWEGGYFASLDIMHDRFGYYICWGVLVWVPAVYCLPALWLVGHPIDLPPHAALAIVGLGLLAIAINYDADAQRRRVRDTDGRTTVWGKEPELIRARWTATDGQERESLLLASGWWGVARHFHYVPELALAAAWTLPAGFTHFLPWFYWLFLFGLLMDRAVRDDRRCAAKYGDDWLEYTRRVRWRVLPGVF